MSKHRHWSESDLPTARRRTPGKIIPTSRLKDDARHPDYVLPVRAGTLRDPRINYAGEDLWFFVTIDCWRAHPWLASARRAAALLAIICRKQRDLGFAVHRLTLMQNHWHALVRPSGAGERLGDIVGSIKETFTKRRRAQGEMMAFWQPKFHDHRVRSSREFESIDAYIVWNAAVAGCVRLPEEWPWCGSVRNGVFHRWWPSEQVLRADRMALLPGMLPAGHRDQEHGEFEDSQATDRDPARRADDVAGP